MFKHLPMSYRSLAEKLKLPVFAVIIIIILPGLPVAGNAQNIRDAEGLHLSTAPGRPLDSNNLWQSINSNKFLVHKHTDSAIQLYQQFLTESKSIGFSHGIISSLFILGSAYGKKGMYEQWIATSKEMIAYCNRFPNIGRQYITAAHSDIGVALRRQGKFTEATKYFFKAAQDAALYPQSQFGIESIYLNLACAMLDNNAQTEEALYYLDRAEEIARLKKDHYLTGLALYNKAYAWYYKAQADANPVNVSNSRQLFETARAFGREHKDTLLQYRSLTSLALPLFHKDNPAQALPYLKEAELFFQKGEDVYVHNQILTQTGDIYMGMGEDSISLVYHLKALTFARAHNMRAQQQNIYENLKIIYKNKRLYKEAFEAAEAAKQIEDSILSHKVQISINDINQKYRSAEKDKEIAEKKFQLSLQEQNISRKNKWVIITTISTVSMALLLLLLYRNFRHKQRLHHSQLLMVAQQQEIDALNAMMRGEEKERERMAQELHDGIGGMLAAIKMNFGAIQKRHSSLRDLDELNPVMNMIEETTNEVRKASHNLMPDTLLNHGLVEALKIWCGTINASGTIQINLAITGFDTNMPTEQQLMIYRIVQELVQNVIKHAAATVAEVELVRRDEKVYLFVEDNGVGFDIDEHHKEGFGLQNLRNRVHVLNGSLSIESARGRGTTINIMLADKKMNTGINYEDKDLHCG